MTENKLLLVGWDSADWKIIHPLLDAGLMPAMASLVERGTSGNLATLEPQLSPMLWTSIATGKMAYHHGVHGFTEVDKSGTAIQPVSASTRLCKTVWEMLGEHGLRSHLVGWFATHGEQELNGCMVSNLFPLSSRVDPKSDPEDWPAPPRGTFWPDDLEHQMAHLRVAPHEISGEEIIRLFVPDGHLVDQQRDKRLKSLAERLAEAYSIHAAATHLMEADPEWNFMAVYYRALDEISHEFMPYHPPRLDGIDRKDFDIYQNVVNMIYRTHDLMLQRLIDLAGPGATVMLVSDHGFHSDHLRPRYVPDVPAGIISWHRTQGIIAAAGPGIKQDHVVHGARLLDIAPTILHHFGLPVGQDMEGRVLYETFTDSREIQIIPSWENNGVSRPDHRTLGEEDNRAVLEQFVALGYIAADQKSNDEGLLSTIRENKWNLARAFFHTGRFAEALPLLEDCFFEVPERNDFSCQLAITQLHLGLIDEADETAEVVLESMGESPVSHLLRGAIHLERGAHAAALIELQAAKAVGTNDLQLARLFTRCHALLHDWDEAELSARQVLEIDPQDVRAHIVLARVYLASKRPEESAEAALNAIGLQYGSPEAHRLLAAALMNGKNFAQAETALLNHLRLAPRSAVGHRMMARTLARLGRAQEAGDYLVKSRMLASFEKGVSHSSDLQPFRAEIARRAKVRREDRAKKRASTRDISPEQRHVAPGEIVVVSGLPRSGTSMMMQILSAGGMTPMTDHLRTPDEDNEEGYWEWEAIKTLAANPTVIDMAVGKVVKVISAQLAHLPSRHRYRVIFMNRDIASVVDSQMKMIGRRSKAVSTSREEQIKVLERHRSQVRDALKKSSAVKMLEVDFNNLVKDPESEVQRLREFLGDDILAGTPAAMATVVRPALVHNHPSHS